MKLFQEEARVRAITLKMNLGKKVDPCSYDALGIYRCLVNLITNALDACPFSGVVVGRDEHENAIIENLARTGDKILVPKDIPGPSVLCCGMVTQDDVSLAGGIAASYIKGGTVMNLKIGG